MSKTKTQAEADKPPEHSTAPDTQQERAEPAHNPTAAHDPTAHLPSTSGLPAAQRATDIATSTQGAPQRAQMTTAMQRTAGNARTGAMLGGSTPAAASGTGLSSNPGRAPEQPSVQRSYDVGTTLDESVTRAIGERRGGGASLPNGIRQDMEGAFGKDFSDVRVHNDAHAHELSRSVHARAFTVGNDIFFKNSTYDMSSTEGRKLLAHELTHVIQQGGASGTPTTVSDPNDVSERSADLVADQVISGRDAVPASEGSKTAFAAFIRPDDPVAVQRCGNHPSVTVARQVSAVGCPPRPAGESQQSRSMGGVLAGDDVEMNAAARRLYVRDFPVNAASPPSGFMESPAWQEAMSLMAGDPTTLIAVAGMTDCVGGLQENVRLRAQRAQAVRDALPPIVRRRVIMSHIVGEYFENNTTPEGRAANRAVKLIWISAPPTGRAAADILSRATTLDEYLFLVRALETRLGLGGNGQARTTISVLRQLYYGNTSGNQREPNRGSWTAAGGRNPAWSWAIPTTPWSPSTDPSRQLGPALMNALQASQVVEGIDVGHLLTGVDAMLNPAAVEVAIGPARIETGLANEEWATWAGDVGSAAAYWVLDTWSRSPTRLPTMAEYFASYASDSDLRGDIEAFAIRAGLSTQPPSATLGQRFNPTAPLSSILMQYYRLTRSALGVARHSRATTFARAYGATVVGGTITNPSVLRVRLRPSVASFAHLFSMQEALKRDYFGDNFPRAVPGQPGLEQLLITGIDHSTALFVDWLQRQVSGEYQLP